jgi:hypothetical protein
MSDNALTRAVDPKSVSPFYGDGGFVNRTGEVTFPLSPKTMLLITWAEKPCPQLLKRHAKPPMEQGASIERRKISLCAH